MRGDRTLLRLIAPIQEDLDHPQVTDIVCNEPYRAWVRKAGRWELRTLPTMSFDVLDAATILIGQRTGREFDEQFCYVNSTMPGGQRFQGVRPPGTKSGRILWAIRRPPTVARKIEDDDFDELTSEVNDVKFGQRASSLTVASAYRNKDWREFFRQARLAGLSIGFCGAMGDGKSDMVRRTMQIFRPETRMVTLETDDECGDAGPDNKAPVFYDDTKVTSDEAVRIAKRLVPSDVVLQEVRGPEAWSLLIMMNSGVSGLTTWHANEGQEHEALCDMAMSHPAASKDRMMEKVRNAFDVIAFCRRNDQGRFRVSSVRLMAQERETQDA